MPIAAAIPLAGTIFVALFLVAMAFYLAHRSLQMKHEERMRMIEKGITPPPPTIQGWPGVKQQEQQLRFEERRLMIEKGLWPPECVPPAPDYLWRGIVALCLGIAGGVAFVLFDTFPLPEGPLVRTWLAVLSPVLALFGIGCLVYYAVAPKRAPQGQPR